MLIICAHCLRKASHNARGLCRTCYRTPAVRRRFPCAKSGPKPGPLCRHCRQALASRPRRLCRQCYDVPGLRDRYPTFNAFARSEQPDFNGPGKAPALTLALPGTPEKINVLQGRAMRGERLFDNKDATYGPD